MYCLTKGTLSPLFSLPTVGQLFPVAQQCAGCLAFCRNHCPLSPLRVALQSWPSGFRTAFLHPLPDHSEHFSFLPKLAEFMTIQRWWGISMVLSQLYTGISAESFKGPWSRNVPCSCWASGVAFPLTAYIPLHTLQRPGYLNCTISDLHDISFSQWQERCPTTMCWMQLPMG